TLQTYLEENKIITIYCPPHNTSISALDLSLIINNFTQTIYYCDILNTPCKSFLGDVAEFNSSGSYFPLSLLSISEKRSIKGLICVYRSNGFYSNYSEEIALIAKAQNVSCLEMQLTNNNTQMSITCMTSKIYPAAQCTFNLPGLISHSHIIYNDSVDYYQSNCTWTSSINNFQVGNYILEVAFYPNITRNTDFETAVTTLFQLAPPKSSPIIHIATNGTDSVSRLQENIIYTVICRAPGGVPPITNITVSCGNITNTMQYGNIFTSPVAFTRNMNGQNCTCTAQYIIGFYENNTNSLQTNILYKSSVKVLSASSNIIDNGTFAQMYCEADGNPAPEIVILKFNKTIAYNSSGYVLFHNASMSCKDAGNYLCQVNNGIEFKENDFKQITLLVRCPLQFTFYERFKNFSIHQGEIFSYNVTIYGYPEPDTFTIYKSNQETQSIIVRKLPIEPPYIALELKIAKLTSTDFDYYSLVIFQNGAKSLTFEFTLNEARDSAINVAAIVGGCIAACLAVIIIIAICYVKRKYEINLICKKKDSEETAKETNTYSELSISQRNQDRHNYEIPMSNTNVPTPETNALYVNVKEKPQLNSAYEEIDTI
ncbi:hypothetical protein BgiBS90_018847, partial [Biomphalaria glabrata]